MAGPCEDIYCDDFGTYRLRAEVWPEGDGEPWFTPQAGDAVFWEIDTV